MLLLVFQNILFYRFVDSNIRVLLNQFKMVFKIVAKYTQHFMIIILNLLQYILPILRYI